jgi:hypothetical protein
MHRAVMLTSYTRRPPLPQPVFCCLGGVPSTSLNRYCLALHIHPTCMCSIYSLCLDLEQVGPTQATCAFSWALALAHHKATLCRWQCQGKHMPDMTYVATRQVMFYESQGKDMSLRFAISTCSRSTMVGVEKRYLSLYLAGRGPQHPSRLGRSLYSIQG